MQAAATAARDAVGNAPQIRAFELHDERGEVDEKLPAVLARLDAPDVGYRHHSVMGLRVGGPGDEQEKLADAHGPRRLILVALVAGRRARAERANSGPPRRSRECGIVRGGTSTRSLTICPHGVVYAHLLVK